MYFILSVLIHTLLIYLFFSFDILSSKFKNNKFVKQRYRFIKVKEKKVVKKKKLLKKDLKNKQIVDIAKPKKEKLAKNPKFLSRYDSSVKKQTKAKKLDNIIPKNPNRKNKNKIVKKKNKIVKPTKKKNKKKKSKIVKPTKKKNKIVKNKKLLKKEVPDKKIELKEKTKVENKGNKENKEKEFEKKEISFKIPDYDFSKMMRTSNDYLKNIEESDVTSLSTLAYVYSGYFIKIKNKLYRYWNPNSAYLRHDPYRKKYGIKDRYTILRVSINSNGYLKSISIKKSCGLTFLDDEAIRAFEAGQPYKVVPKGLVKNRDYFVVNWGFYVENPSSTKVFYLNH